MHRLIEILHDENCSCVVRNFDKTYTFSQSGITDLYNMIKNKPCFLKGAAVADKVVGKGAAALMILGGVTEIYADVISLSALMLLHESGINVDFERIVPFIWNRDKTDWCPLERLCYNQTSAGAILPLIDDFFLQTEEVRIPEPI